MSDPQKGKKGDTTGRQKNTPNTYGQPSPESHQHLPLHGTEAVNRMPPPSHCNFAQQQNVQKVAIPRMRRDSDAQSTATSSTAGDKNRVTHACEECRHRKTKCSGDRPMCKHCEDFDLVCYYAGGKRDRTKRQIDAMAKRLDNYESLLRELGLRADEKDQKRILNALDRENFLEDDDTSGFSPTKSGIRSRSGDSDPAGPYLFGEHYVTARVGSTQSLDKIEEDFDRDSATRATGYHGKNSELTWMQRLKRNTTNGSSDDHDSVDEEQYPSSLQADPSGSGLSPVNESTYHCDDLTISVAEQVDAFELPTRHIANALLQNYMDTVHSAFPIIGRMTFTQQYQKFFDNENTEAGNSWLAILNLIFAIGAKYSHLIQAEYRGDRKDHLIYFTRARMLGFNADSILGHAELQKVQITGLMAFYLMATNQINRSWATSGMAIRYASALGLNLRNDNRNVVDSSKEIRYRVWWALCSVERILAVMLGRLISFSQTDCTAPMPVPLEEEVLFSNTAPSSQRIQMLRRWSSQESRPNDTPISTPSPAHSHKMKASPIGSQSVSPASSAERKPNIAPNNSLYFLFHTKLSVLTGEVLHRLYRAGNMESSWAQNQATMSDLNTKMETWQVGLPHSLDFTRRQRDQQFIRQRMSLGFFYYSTMTLINRPCLCRVDRKIPNESSEAKDFNRSSATKCVHAACDMLDLLPNEPNPIGLYKVAPWWCLIHYLMQAVTVLMLELSFRADHMPTEVEDIFEAAKKTVQWLRSMRDEDVAADRAWRMCDDMLRRVAPKVGRDAREVSPDEAPFAQAAPDHMQGLADMQVTQATNSYGNAYSAPFQPQMFTSYDQCLSWDGVPINSPPATLDNMFPTVNGTESINFNNQQAPGYFTDPNQPWLPYSGTQWT